MPQKVTIDLFDSWLEAWSIYEALVMDVAPLRYKELARYRDVIQKANRKFVWSAVYNYDAQFRLSLNLNTSARFDTVDTTLYTTILDLLHYVIITCIFTYTLVCINHALAP